MKILVTGAKGFVGKNLIAELKNRKYEDVLEYDLDTAPELLEGYAKECDFVFHLAGVNRPKDEKEFMEGNFGFTSVLLDLLEKNNNKAPILITSSIQANLDNPYGQSKKAGEDLLFDYSKKTGAKVYVYRLPNVFGKWCRPNYNSAVATFCNNIAAGLPIQVNDPSVVMRLVYIDDVVDEFIRALSNDATALEEGIVYTTKLDEADNGDNLAYIKGEEIPASQIEALLGEDGKDFKGVPVIHETTLGEIVRIISSFPESRKNLTIPNMSDGLTSKLYSTYLSYLPTDQFGYDLKMNCDDRGSFTEFIRNKDRGQVSVNISKPGITKGQHWHHSKNEKFLVVKGQGLIRFRKIDTEEIIEYPVSGEKLQVIDIPTGYTHSIVNVGEEDMVTVMWANEPFNPDKPDTFFLPV